MKKPSSRFHKKRRNTQKELLQDYFASSEEQHFIEQDYVLQVMNLGESEKIQVTNAIREAFPEVKVDRRTIEGKCKTIYKGLRKKIPFRLVATDQASSSTDQASSSTDQAST